MLLLSGSGRLADAQEGQPPTPPAPNAPPPDDPRAGPRQDQNGIWYLPEEQAVPMKPAGQASLTSGGPDNFGYTWNDSVPLAWIDASSGTETGINSSTDHAGPIEIGFFFKYYENTYAQLFISHSGFVAFNEDHIRNGQSQIPSTEQPDDVIAPNWAPANNINGYIRYIAGGIAPNRWFVVEWNRVENYTFEMILYENGDIDFQYQTMTYSDSRSCQTSGIEDSQGTDGLTITNFCDQIAPDHAVRIYRPAPAARVNIYPLYQSAFTYAGGTTDFQIHILNTGELGADVYDLTPSSDWPVSLYAADGTTLLIDTDSDGVVDTGSVAQGNMFTATMKIQTPALANVGDGKISNLLGRSSLNTSRSRIVTLQTAIPAPFAQAYRDNYDDAMSLYLVQPGGQSVKQPPNPYWYGSSYPAVAEAPNGDFAYFWNKGGSIEYALLNKYGDTVRAVSKLADNDDVTVVDSNPAVAVAPDGRIGVLWDRSLHNNNDQSNHNLFFAILDASGNIVYGPANLTNNTIWVPPWDNPDWPQFYDPRIAATGDSRFALAWERINEVSNCTSIDCSFVDIYYAVRNTGGSEVKGITNFTNDTAGNFHEGYFFPSLAALSGNRILITWQRGSDADIYYAVLDSAGNVVRDKTNLSGDGFTSYDSGSDAVQLSDGKVVVGWERSGEDFNDETIRFAVLDTAYDRIAGPTSLTLPAAADRSSYVSMAADNAGHAILTWMDGNSSNLRNLYYALVNGSGDILTQPMIFRTSQAYKPSIETSMAGYGNTSYTSSFATGVDTAVWPDSPLAGGAPGGAAPIGVNYTNYGQTTATGLVLTATLGSGLTYLSDTSGTSPTFAGNLITWSLPDLSFLDKRQFVLYLGVPGTATIGARYPVVLAVTANESDFNASDNTVNLEVMSALQVYLPLVMR